MSQRSPFLRDILSNFLLQSQPTDLDLAADIFGATAGLGLATTDEIFIVAAGNLLLEPDDVTMTRVKIHLISCGLIIAETIPAVYGISCEILQLSDEGKTLWSILSPHHSV